MIELTEEGFCFPKLLVGVNVALALVDGFIAVVSLAQKLDLGYYRCPHWINYTGFIPGTDTVGGLAKNKIYIFINGLLKILEKSNFCFAAFPNVLFSAAFLLLLSFWVDLCHQSDDEDDEDEESSAEESLLEKTFNERNSLNADNHNHRRCLPFRLVHVRSRQKIVILATLLAIVIMFAFAVIIWIGMGKNPIDSTVVARVYVEVFAGAMLLLAGALACYGILICLKMSKVRTERASSELWKVAGLAVVCVICFTSSAFVALLTDIPMLYHWHDQEVNGVCIFLLIVYYFVGSSMPSAFLLWVMREVPPLITAYVQPESATLTFVSDTTAAIPNPHHWTTAPSVRNQISRASPI
ncbi:hypothetical protein CsatA_024097 [Cannabis sativa]